MSTEKKRFIVIEDELAHIAGVRMALEASGHILKDRARTLEDALTLVKAMTNKGHTKLVVDAILLDGNLRTEAPAGYEPGDDAKTILAALEEAGLRNRVKVIGMSRDTIEGVDVNIYKSMSDEILKSKLDGAILDLFPTPLKLEKPKKKALKQRFTKPAKR